MLFRDASDVLWSITSRLHSQHVVDRGDTFYALGQLLGAVFSSLIGGFTTEGDRTAVGGDVLMGSIMTVSPSLHMRIKLTHMRLGIGVGANDAEMVLRSLSSIALRYHAHDVSARVLAAALQRQPAVVQLLHPAFEGAPGHAHWKALCGSAHQGQGAAAGLFSVVIGTQFGQNAIDRFCDSLQYFKLGYSWGGPMSLVVPYQIEGMRGCGGGALKAGTVVRFCVGLEDTQDLLRDLAQAWEKAFDQAWKA